MQNSDWTTANKLVKDRKWSEAFAAFEKAIKVLPDDPDLIHDRAVCLFNLGEKKAALAELNRALDLQPDYSYRYASRAYMRSALKDVEGAIEDYKKAIELDPEDAISMNNLGLLEEQQGYKKEANERYQLADELNQILDERGIAPDFKAAPNEKPSEPAKVQTSKPSAIQTDTGSMTGQMKKVFTSKKGFKEFIAFLRNGLKLGSSKEDQRDEIS